MTHCFETGFSAGTAPASAWRGLMSAGLRRGSKMQAQRRPVRSIAALLALCLLALPGPVLADESTETAIETAVAATGSTAPATQGSAARATKECQPNIGCVTNLPLPRYVSLKGDQGNARRGPGLTHRIDWVFTRPGMPLKVTAEYENWRRVEDQDGAGGWVHYALLSGVRSALITTDMAEFHDAPRNDARITAQAEMGVVAKILQCQPGWCRIATGGERGWVQKSALWGVDEAETID